MRVAGSTVPCRRFGLDFLGILGDRLRIRSRCADNLSMRSRPNACESDVEPPPVVFFERRRHPDRRLSWRGGRRDGDWLNRPPGALHQFQRLQRGGGLASVDPNISHVHGTTSAPGVRGAVGTVGYATGSLQRHDQTIELPNRGDRRTGDRHDHRSHPSGAGADGDQRPCD